MSYYGTKFYYVLAPEFKDHPPKNIISGPDILEVCPYLGIGGVPLTLSRDQTKFSVSKIRKSLR